MITNIEQVEVNSTKLHQSDRETFKQNRDEVDFVPVTQCLTKKTHDGNHNKIVSPQCTLLSKRLTPGTLYGDCEVKTSIKTSLSALEKLSLFHLTKKKNDQNSGPPSIKNKQRFAKAPALAKFLGNTYNTKKFENELNDLASAKGSPVTSAKRFGNSERFQKCSKEDAESEVCLQDFREDKDLSAKAFRTISRSLGKLWWKRTFSVDISTPDPEFKVSYLGNVLTGWAKGEGCIEKPLNTLWRNYSQNHKPDVIMRMRICASGLKATTRQHGLTEYWANRITYCCAPQNYPRVFCWIYRHEGRKLKHELRCHAVLCSKESVAQDICNTLKENLERALREFKREKISKQNARLSLANSVYENPSLPRRKILLSVGGNNYRPPMERSKSAPKLMAIEEAIGEDDDEDVEQTNEPEMPSCCQKDSLYPAMTLGRRRCRRGHSIRRTGKPSKYLQNSMKESNPQLETLQSQYSKEMSTKESSTEQISYNISESETIQETTNVSDTNVTSKSTSSLGSDEDDLEKLLSYHNYDTNSPLAGELLSYFDMKIKPKTSSLTNLNDDTIIFEPLILSGPMPRSSLSLDNLDNCSDEEGNEYDELDYTDEVYYRQTAILNLLHRNSLRRMANLTLNDENSNIDTVKSAEDVVSSSSLVLGQQQQHLDSDEGSISSGCETASTVTTNMDDTSLKYNSHQQPQRNYVSVLEKQDETNRNNSDDIKICNATINFNLRHIPDSIRRANDNFVRREKTGDCDVSDSEFSDESGYVEFQEQNLLQRTKSVVV